MDNIQDKLNQTKKQVIDALNQSEGLQTVLFYVATICGAVVGVVQFSVRAFNDNNGAEKVRNFTLTVLTFINNISGKLVQKIDTDVPDVEVAQ